MTDERIDALIRRLDVQSQPDAAFARETYAVLKPRARTARVTDASRIGRLRRDVRLVLSNSGASFSHRPVRLVAFAIVLMLAAIVGLAIAGALRRAEPLPGGPLLFSTGGELQAIDSVDGSVRSILPAGERAEGVSRSPDGRLVAFWTLPHGQSHLYVVGVDGRDRRELGVDLSLRWITGGIDTWSSDSRFLATEVVLGSGLSRILIVDVATGAARAVTPARVVAHNPLWSPDGQWVAFTSEAGATRSLAVIRTDGSGMRTVSGVATDVAGPDTWTPDGTWIYFDGGGAVSRANVAGGFSERLTTSDLEAWGPASSPDGTRIAFIVHRSGPAGWDLYIANGDGTGAHRLLEHAQNDGWSTDGQFLLTEWTPDDQPGGLAIIAPDGSGFRVLLPFQAACRMDRDPRQTCLLGVGWGEPMP
jgi:tricorn protease-like protein